MTSFTDLTGEEKKDILRIMYTSRIYEEKVRELNENGYVHGTLHLAIGQEANHAGVAKALRTDDWIMGTHRGHGHYLAKGGSPIAMLAEVMGLESGICEGLSGSMHFSDLDNYNMGSSAVVAGSLPISVGMAMALKYKGRDNIVAAFLGDGATNQGMAMEAFNLAEVWAAPLLFYCENNMYAISSAKEKFIAAADIYKRAESFKIKSAKIDGNDVEAVFNAVNIAAEYIRKEKQPYFIQADTYRLCGHSRTDACIYRSAKEENLWREKCPIKAYEEKLIKSNIMTDKEQSKLKADIQTQADKDALYCIEHKNDTLKYDKAVKYTYTDFGGELWAK